MIAVPVSWFLFFFIDFICMYKPGLGFHPIRFMFDNTNWQECE